MKKLLITLWLIPFMVVLGITPQASAENKVTRVEGASTEDGASSGATAGNSPCSSAPYANLMADPVDSKITPNPGVYKILSLTEEACVDMGSGSGKVYRVKLRKGTAIAVPQIPGAGDLRVVSCWNPLPKVYGTLAGKYFECPTLSCPEPITNTVEVPGPTQILPAPDQCPNIDLLQERVPRGMMVDSNGNCVNVVTPRRRMSTGAKIGIGAGAVILCFLTGVCGGGGDDDHNDDCCPTAPRIP